MMSPAIFRRVSFLLFTALLAAVPARIVAADEPPVPDGTKEAEAKLAGFRVPAGVKVELFAAEPKLGGPVAIALDEKGRVFVSEEYRFNRGTEENRTRPFFLDDDLQIKTLDDRLAMFRKFADKFEGGMDWFSRWSDQVRMVEDRDGDGRADHSTVFAGGFNEPLAGLAEGVLARDGDVYFTCIPHLWRLCDKDGDGVADEREKLLTGFGVNAAFLGHDLHGLSFGPDGKLYFSIGDRGFHVQTKEGTTLSGPRTGAVFRCNPDGTKFEVVHRGLRNPQELAWDECGNLFAVDNNCDKGDHSRLVYVVEGGESGWNMAYQSIPEPYLTGPWHAEKLWHLEHEGQAAYIVPPVGKLGAGPSGFAWYSHGALPEKFRGRFFYCNYAGNGGIETFTVKPKGAAFELVDMQDFLKPISATDVDFGYDGKLYTSDFVNLIWEGGNRKGRIYTAFEPEKLADPQVVETREAFIAGFRTLSIERLAELLRHPDYRTRLRAQFELAARATGETPSAESLATLVAASSADNARPTRLHGLWGLGQVADSQAAAREQIAGFLSDSDVELRAHAARLVGDLGHAASAPRLAELLKDPEPRVQYFALQSLGKLKHATSIDAIFQLVSENADRDRYLRHAAVVAIERIGDKQAVAEHRRDGRTPCRMVVALVLRRWGMFLSLEEEPVAEIIAESARTINDLLSDAPPEGRPRIRFRLSPLHELAKLLERASPVVWGSSYEAITRRAINANFRGDSWELSRLLDFVKDRRQSLPMRREALAAVADWAMPSPRDRVTGFWRPLHTMRARDALELKGTLETYLPSLLRESEGDLRNDLLKVVGKLNLRFEDATFAEWVVDEERSLETRLNAFELLVHNNSILLDKVLDRTLRANHPRLRAAACAALLERDPQRAGPLLQLALQEGELIEQQGAIQALGKAKSTLSRALLRGQFEELAAGTLPKGLELDLLEAARVHFDNEIRELGAKHEAKLPSDKILARLAVCLEGGDVELGRQIFFRHAQAQCVRCHKIEETGGTAGPELSGVGLRGTREHLLESLLVPAAKIAPGFGTVTLTLADGRVVAGTIAAEDKETIRLVTPTGKTETIKLAEIEDRSAPTSAMPSVEKILTPRELRDLIEFLASLKRK